MAEQLDGIVIGGTEYEVGSGNDDTCVLPDDSTADLNIGDPNGNVLAQFKNGHIKTKQFDSSNVGTTDNLVLSKRRAVVSFSFDDNPTNDAKVMQIFKDNGVRCGFAIITASSRYKDYYLDGFEIMAHAGGT